MSYRIGEPKPKRPNRTLQKLTTPAQFYMINGTILNIALPCWYQEIIGPMRAKHHCYHWHDHVGQPSPNHHDHVCQVHDFAHYHHKHHPHHTHHDLHHYIDMKNLIPVHLLEEGYTKVHVSTVEDYEGLEFDGFIDTIDDWIVRVDVKAYLEEAITEPIDVKLIVKVSNEAEDKVDVVFIGKLRIMPAPID